jgi:hypothetical protein
MDDTHLPESLDGRGAAPPAREKRRPPRRGIPQAVPRRDNPDARLLTVADIVERSGYCAKTVRGWLKAGRLRGPRIGGHRGPWRVHPGDWAAFLERTRWRLKPRK